MADRSDYERDVRALAEEVKHRRAEGQSSEQIARALVHKRNLLKASYRREDDPSLVALMEARNLARYGNALGPDADAQYRKYGDWDLVIEAACRPALISRG